MSASPRRAPRLLAISDGCSGLEGGRERLAAWVRALATSGVDAVQLREKDLDDRARFGLTRLARSLLPPGVLLLVNGRADIALAAGADGAHLPASGLPVAALRTRFGAGLILGRSTHRLEEVEAALDDGTDYVTFGPVYATPSKEAYGPPSGLEALRRAAAVGVPVLALGGVSLERLSELADTGAAGVAGIRAFQEPSTLPELVRRARELFPGQQP